MEYRINITFYSGEASACPVCKDICPPGPQPVSNFTIQIKTINQPPATLRGDLNHDGNVTSADVMIALRIAVSCEFIEEADIDENGCVNALDAFMIMQVAVGNIEL
ncbi:MAG: dockerin type I domain-containing protein [Euryarchaeota archaeon]|nr:dockerin type I domain-containing protein [Euryarchaeota archaeon]